MLTCLPLPATGPSCEPNRAAKVGTPCLPASRVTWWLLWALGTSCKGGQVVLHIRLRKVLLLISLQQDAVNQFPGLVLWCEVSKEKNKTFFFFFKSKSALEIILSSQKCRRKGHGVSVVRKLPKSHLKTGLLPDCKDLMLEEECFIYAA